MRIITFQNMRQKSAIISGVALLIMTIAAFFSQGYVHSSIVISGDAVTTLKNMQASLSLFHLEIVGWLIIIITDVIVSWAFYVFLKPIDRAYALLAFLLRLIYTAVLIIAVSHLIIASGTAEKSLFSESLGVAAQQVMLSITTFESIWSLGLIIFGLHLIAVGFVAMKEKRIPKIISILVVVAGFSYLFIHFMYGFMPHLDNVTKVLEMILMGPMFVGELGFGIWLLVKGRKIALTD